jgi:hypothetical protein
MKTVNKMKRKKEKSLCETCSNRVVISFHGEYNGKKIKPNIADGHCYYEFTVSADIVDKYENIQHDIDFHVSGVIVDTCSFYNKSQMNLLKKKDIEDNDDTDDSNDSNKSNNSNGVTFINIPGALLP